MPVLGSLLVKLAPAIKRLAERINAGMSLRQRICELETCALEQRQRINLALSLAPGFSSSCPRISVIINTNGRPDELASALPTVLGQNYPDFEVICVAGPDRDGTVELIREFGDRVRILKCPEYNIAMSRNIGLEEARGEIVAFMDDDALAAPDWLLELSRAFVDKSVVAAGGYVHDATGIGWQARVCVADRFGDVRHYSSVKEAGEKEGSESSWGALSYFSPTGVNMAFSRKALQTIGGFDENFAWHLDETDVFLRLAESGGKIRFCPGAEVTHKFAANKVRAANRTPLGFYNQAKSKAYFIFRHAAPIWGKDASEKRLTAYLKWLDATAKTALRTNLLQKCDYERLRDELEKGRRDGQDLASYNRDCLLGQ